MEHAVVAPLPPPLPSHGPRMLFFSGGTALRDTAHELSLCTWNTVHVITPFDSGGSSAALRTAFGMPAVGDLRARVMALADDRIEGKPEIYTLFAYRLPRDASPRALRSEAASLVQGAHPLMRQIPESRRLVIRQHLEWFMEKKPENFPLAGASIGNLVLAGGYLEAGRKLSPVITLFSRLTRARGIVRPVTEEPAHLAVRLASGEVIVGQHRFTGKELTSISSPITDIWLTGSERSSDPVRVRLAWPIARRIQAAGLICYPVGSFYSSLVANLLPAGVGRAIASSPAFKVFVPNLGDDPELFGHTIRLQVERLLRPLLADAPAARTDDMLHAVLVDPEHTGYSGEIPQGWLAEQGIATIYAPLLAKLSPHLPRMADARRLSGALLHLAGQYGRSGSRTG